MPRFTIYHNIFHKKLTKEDVLCLVHWILGRPSCCDDLTIKFPEIYTSDILNENHISLVYQIYEGDFYSVKKRSASLDRLLNSKSAYDKKILKTRLDKLIESNEYPSIERTHPVLSEVAKLIGQLTRADSSKFFDSIIEMKQKTMLRDKVHLKNALKIVRELQRIFCENCVFYEYSILSDFEDALECKLSEESTSMFDNFKKVFIKFYFKSRLLDL